jgi:DNA topoisomerase-1
MRYGVLVDVAKKVLDGTPIDVTMAQALELLATPKAARRGFGAKKEPIKVFAESPLTKQPVQLLSGRYGPYVTDGTTNASLPRDLPEAELTFEQALKLLEERAAKGPPEKKGRRKSAKASGDGAAPKKAAKKKKNPKGTDEEGPSKAAG